MVRAWARASVWFMAAACSTGPRAPRVAAPAAPAPATARAPVALLEVKPFFVPGETITWDVTLAGVEGGRARLAVGQIGTAVSGRFVALRAEAESAGLAKVVSETRDTIDSWIDVDSGLPARTESTSTSGGPTTVVRADRVAGAALAHLDVYAPRYGADGMHRAQRLPNAATHDPLSVMLALRGWDAPAGARVLLYSLGGVRIWKNVFTGRGREQVDGPLGRRAALRIDGVSTRITPTLQEDVQPARVYSIWVTDDAQHIPIRIVAHTELGDITAQATSYQVASATTSASGGTTRSSPPG
jgi:hypothetical protein